MTDCIFCGIIRGEIETDLVYEDQKMVAFRDINPQAPVHILLVPKKHIRDLLALAGEDAELISHIHLEAAKLAEKEGLAAGGFRMVLNCGDDGGQTVGHIHFHLLGGRKMKWPPG